VVAGGGYVCRCNCNLIMGMAPSSTLIIYCFKIGLPRGAMDIVLKIPVNNFGFTRGAMDLCG
jgi:hypothetical protein